MTRLQDVESELQEKRSEVQSLKAELIGKEQVESARIHTVGLRNFLRSGTVRYVQTLGLWNNV